MLAYVPVRFDLYRQLPARLWPVMAVLVAHADRNGVCWPSLRRIAKLIGVPKSTVGRYLAELVRAGHLSRSRKPGRVYTYQVAAEWLPMAAKLPVSQTDRTTVPQIARAAVPPSAPEEKSIYKKIPTPAVPLVREPMDGEAFRWRARMRQWRNEGLWVVSWGPLPGEAGCRAPQNR